MKRKLFCMLCFIISTIVILCVTGCNNKQKEQGNEEKGNSNVFQDGCYILADWENYEQCKEVFLDGFFGKVSPSTEHATLNAHSGKLEILGYAYTWGNTYPSLYVNTKGQYFQKIDFSDCDAFLFDIYSEMEYEVPLWFYINYIEQSTLVNLTIKPGENHFEITKGELGARWLNEIDSFRFQFNRGENYSEQQVLYIDNFRAHKKVV